MMNLNRFSGYTTVSVKFCRCFLRSFTFFLGDILRISCVKFISMFSWNSIRDSGDFAVDSISTSNNTYLHNDFIDSGIPSCLFYVSGLPDTFLGNYWGRPRILPKIIIGTSSSTFLFLRVDWRPAWKPNVIS